MQMPEFLARRSPRERQLIVGALVVVVAALAFTFIWQPMNADAARLARDLPRMQAALANARAQADEIASRSRTGAAAPAQAALPAVERVLAERNLKAGAGTVGAQDGRVRLDFAMLRFDALPGLLDALARSAGLVATEVTLVPRVEPGHVRAELTLRPAR
jgi:type II secretory pathway component PulM